MANTKHPSQAEKAAAQSKRGSAAKGTKAADKPSVNASSRLKQSENKTEARQIPPRFFSSAILLSLFVVFLVMLFTHEGKIVNLVYNTVLGLIG